MRVPEPKPVLILILTAAGVVGGAVDGAICEIFLPYPAMGEAGAMARLRGAV